MTERASSGRVSIRTRARRLGVAARATLATALLAATATAAEAGVEEGRAKAAVCAACHGATGNATMPGVPSLAAQPKQFLVPALFQFREGKRVNPVMLPLAANLSNADLNDLAAFFAEQAASANPAADEALAQQGRALAAQFNCVACHAANLMGQQHIPRLAGQQADYLREQLRAFKAGTRADLDGTMTSAAQPLTPEHIDVLARYLSGLPAAR